MAQTMILEIPMRVSKKYARESRTLFLKKYAKRSGLGLGEPPKSIGVDFGNVQEK